MTIWIAINNFHNVEGITTGNNAFYFARTYLARFDGGPRSIVGADRQLFTKTAELFNISYPGQGVVAEAVDLSLIILCRQIRAFFRRWGP